LIQAKMGASDDIKSTTGQYDSSLGATSNERSGRAILAREKQGDTGTYHYVDNLARAIRHITRQLVDMIPKIYDTERIARIVGLDGEVDMVKINPQQPNPVNEIRDMNTGIVIEKIYNPGVGRYDVVVTTGPSYMTKRQEAMDAMSQILQGNPQLWSVAGDLFVKNMDWPGSEELAARLAKTIDPKLLEDGDKDPALQAAEQQMQAMGAELDQMAQMMQNFQKSVEVQDLERKNFEAEIKAYQAETQRISAVSAGMTAEQIQDIVMGTIAAALDTGDLVGQELQREPIEIPPQALEPMQPEMAPEMMPPEQMPPEGMMPQ
jgi:hypothetical protein